MNEYANLQTLVAPKIKKLLEQVQTGGFDSVRGDFLELYDYSKANPALINLRKLLESIRKNFDVGTWSGKDLQATETIKARLKSTVCIVTPSFNAAETIEETILSVLNQAGNFVLRYHVQDGGSTDGTIDILKLWERRFKSGLLGGVGRKVYFSYRSEPDEGMYDAIVKGFNLVLQNGDNYKTWMGWINSDDQLYSGAIQYLADVDSSKHTDNINWLTGITSVRKEDGTRDSYRVPMTTDLVSNGLCDGKHWWYLQQEGTFWRKFLWEECDAESILIQHKLAGDWRLWYEFSKRRVLIQALRPLGVFNIRHGQLSQTSLADYNKEIEGILSEDARKDNFAKLKESGVEAIEAIRVDSSGEIIITKSPVLIESEMKIASVNNPKNENTFFSRADGCQLDPYFFRTYSISENAKRETLGIVVFGHTRVNHIEAVIRSLANQGAAKITNVWIDGHQGKQALIEKTQKVVDVATKYEVGKIVRHNGQLGFRKILIQGLIDMANRYESIIVLEDDCYPTADAVSVFSDQLKDIANDPNTFSVYGHHFLTPSEGEFISRFQGWGWATTSAKLRPVLHQLIDCYSMPEEKFLEFVSLTLTDEVKAIIDVTPPRNPSVCLERFFAWDETVALLTGLMGLRHKKAPKRIVYNIGMDEGEHFIDKPLFRQPPFNMLTLTEALKLDSAQETKES